MAAVAVHPTWLFRLFLQRWRSARWSWWRGSSTQPSSPLPSRRHPSPFRPRTIPARGAGIVRGRHLVSKQKNVKKKNKKLSKVQKMIRTTSKTRKINRPGRSNCQFNDLLKNHKKYDIKSYKAIYKQIPS